MTQVANIQTTQVVAVSENTIQVITVGQQGPPGYGIPAGGTTGQSLRKRTDQSYDVEWSDDTDASVLQQDLTAGEAISAYRAVFADLDGKIYVASHDDVVTAQSVRGITTQAGAEDDEINVVAEGEVENSSWNWSGNQNLFLGVAGAITNVAPSTGYCLRVGYATGAQKMFVDIGQAILLT